MWNYLIPPTLLIGDFTRSRNTHVWPGGVRATAKEFKDKPHRIVVIGGSFTFGSAIANEDTFAWKLQEAFPDYQVLNFETGAYGSYQSLLLLEEYFASPHPADLVLYGYINHHQNRNVATATWMHSIEKYSTKWNHVYIPYCTLDERGELIRHTPERHPRFPLREQLCLSALAERFYIELITKKRTAQRRTITKKIIQEMKELSTSHGAKSACILLDSVESSSTERTDILNLMRETGSEYIDCIVSPRPELALYDGHPNEMRNAQYAKCIIKAIVENHVLN